MISTHWRRTSGPGTPQPTRSGMRRWVMHDAPWSTPFAPATGCGRPRTKSSPALAATVTPTVPAEAAQQEPPALAWPSEVSFDQDGQVILPKVRRKHQLDAGAKIEQALVELGLLSGQRLKYTFVSDIVLGC